MPRNRFRLQAGVSIREAHGWNEGRVAGRGRTFIAELKTTLAFLQPHHQTYAAVGDDRRGRRALLHRFPYSLVYEGRNAEPHSRVNNHQRR